MVEKIGGFVVRTLPKAEKTDKNEIAHCWSCGSYGTRGDMIVKNHRYYCKKCKDR